MEELIQLTKKGLYCARGDFYIDPWQPVDTAVITHGHSDHARTGSKQYHASASCVPLLRHRLGQIRVEGHQWGKPLQLSETKVSFHPAGHILGSAQIRVEHNGNVWVMSGDYKRTPDASCEAFEVVPCDVFISEATFALPVYSWEPGEITAKKIFNWLHQDRNRPSIVFCYALGKAQRILAEMKRYTNETIYLHGSMAELTRLYRDQGIPMLPTELVTDLPKDFDFSGKLILAPPSAHRSVWMKRFKEPQTAFASGWMQIRGARRRGGYEKGFVLSDHADWRELIQTITETKAKKVYLTHGREDVLARYLREKGLQVESLRTEYEGEQE